MITETEASEVLDEILHDIHECVLTGFDEYIAEYRQVSAIHHARTRANIIHDHITSYALKTLSKYSFVHFIECCGRRIWDVKGKLLIHFKRLDDRLIGRNYPTQLALDFSEQNHLPGLPANLPRLTVGYVPNRDWTRINGVFVTLSKGSVLMWAKNLTEGDEDQQNFPLPIPAPTPIIPQKRVVAKHRKARKSDSTGNTA